MPRRPVVRILLVGAIVLVALVGMTPRHRAGEEVEAATPRTRRLLLTSVISPTGRDRFSVVPVGVADATITAPVTNLDSNLREVFWEDTAADVADGGACATWQSASTPLLQQGIA